MREPQPRPGLGQQGLCNVPQCSCITSMLCFYELLPVRLREQQPRGRVVSTLPFIHPKEKKGWRENQRFGVVWAGGGSGCAAGACSSLCSWPAPQTWQPRQALSRKWINGSSCTAPLPSACSMSFVDYFNSTRCTRNTRWRDQLPSGLTREFSPLQFPLTPTQQLPSLQKCLLKTLLTCS